MNQESSGSPTAFDDLFPEDVSRPTEKRDDWVWIYLPFSIAVLALAGVSFLIFRAEFGSTSAWADASLTLILLPAILLGLVPLILMGLTIYGVIKLIGILPEWFQIIRRVFRQAENAAQRTGDIAVRPLIVMKSSQAALRASCVWLVSIVRIFKGDTND